MSDAGDLSRPLPLPHAATGSETSAAAASERVHASTARRVLLVGNYEPDRQQSMRRYGLLLQQRLAAVVHELDVLAPGQSVSKLVKADGELGKWIGYAEKFLIFPFRLAWRSRSYDVIHICDHGNAPYVLVLPKRRTLITCHDCLSIRAARGSFQGVHTRWTGRIAQRLILASLRRAHHLVCVSEATRGDLAELTCRPPTAIAVIHNVLTYPYRRMPPEETAVHLHRLGIEQNAPFFLHVGNNSWYKNRVGALRLYRELISLDPFRRHFMILVGKSLPSEMYAWLTTEQLDHRVLVLENISGDDLCAIYNSADALLFPSLHEGFGWPIIEAQACGCLVVTSRREPMMSVAGGAGILVDPLDAGQSAREIASRWRDREDLIGQGYRNVTRYDGEKFAEAYVQAYDTIAQANE